MKRSQAFKTQKKNVYICTNSSWFWYNYIQAHEKTLWMTQFSVPLMVFFLVILHLKPKNKHTCRKVPGTTQGTSKRWWNLKWILGGICLHPRIDYINPRVDPNISSSSEETRFATMTIRVEYVCVYKNICIYSVYLYIIYILYTYSTSWVCLDMSSNYENRAQALIYTFTFLYLIRRGIAQISRLQRCSFVFLSTKTTNGSPNFSHLHLPPFIKWDI